MKQPLPRLKTNRSGLKVLYVYYDNALANFDSEIDRAERRFDLVGEKGVTVICLPVSMFNDNKDMDGHKLSGK